VRFLQDEAGVEAASLEAVGRGEHHPLATNKTAVGRSQNRRIEIILSPRVRVSHQPAAAAATRPKKK
jgi:chemotaxis protein MotB